MGIWKQRDSQDFFSKNIIIDSIHVNEFTGVSVIKQKGLPIVIALNGAFNRFRFYFKNGLVLSGEESIKNYSPECNACITRNRITIKEDSIILTTSIRGCSENCDDVNTYYRLFCEYDTPTQLKLVKLFGSTSQIASFIPCQQIEENHLAAIRKKQIADSIQNLIDLAKIRHQHVLDSITFENDAREKRLQDSLRAIAQKQPIPDSSQVIANRKQQQRKKPLTSTALKLKQQHIADSIAAAKQRQHIDSLQRVARFIKLKEQQRIKDSIAYAAELNAKRKQHIADSLKNEAVLARKRQKMFEDSIAAVKRRQQQIEDSIAAVKKRQQQIEDSLQNVAKLREQRRQDSLNGVAARIRQQHKEDSITAIKKRQQHIEDSLQNVAKLREQRRQDSLNEVAAGIRHQHKEDSIAAVKKRQQQIEDSLQNVAKLREQRRQDSLNEVAARIRQQHNEDSIAAVKKRHRQIEDSLQNVAKLREQQRQDSLNEVAARIRQQHKEDSIAAVKKYQQQIEDSLQNVAKLREQRKQDSLINVAAKLKQQHIEDSIITAKRQKQIEDSIAVAKKRQKQVADSLQNLALIKEQRTKDSLNRIEIQTQQSALDSLKTPLINTTVKSVLEERNNVLLKSYRITTPDIFIELFDNAEVDGDRISVYHNNSLVITNQTLSTKAISFTIHADTANRLHEFILVAENLGSIPPNSALMRVTVGKQVYKLFVKTDLKTNARIVFYYDGN